MSKFMDRMKSWKVILESRSPNEVQNAYFEWMKIESCARAYVRDVSTALKLYFEFHHQGHEFDLNKPAEEFVYTYQSWGVSAPYISAHTGSAGMLAYFLWMFKPGLDAIQLGGLTASAKMFDREIVKEEAVAELRDKLRARGVDLPRICDPWPFAA